MSDKKNAQNPPSAAAEVSAKGNEGRASLREMLKTLSYRGREIIKLRYGFEDGYAYTEEEVAHIFKVAPESIRQVEAEAKEKLCKVADLTTEQIENILASHTKNNQRMKPISDGET